MQELLLLTAFFSMAWGPTCETESAHLVNASGCAHGDAAVTPADLRCSGAALDVCRARPNSGEEAGPPGCGATKHQGAALDMLRHRSSAGRPGHLQRGGRALGLQRMRAVPRTDGDMRREAHAHGGGARGHPLLQPDDLLVELGGEAHLRTMRQRGWERRAMMTTRQVTRGSSRT